MAVKRGHRILWLAGLAILAVAVTGQSTDTTTSTTDTATLTTDTTSSTTTDTFTSSQTTDTDTLSTSPTTDSSSTDSSTTTSSSSTTDTTSTTSTTSSSTESTVSTTSSTTPAPLTLPASTDASSYLSYAYPGSAAQPAWATGPYFTSLASALYAVDKSFVERTDYQAITSAIYSAGEAQGGSVSSSLASSHFGWGAVTTNGWYNSSVPTAYQTDVKDYVSGWRGAEGSVRAQATGAKTGGAARLMNRLELIGGVFGGMLCGIMWGF